MTARNWPAHRRQLHRGGPAHRRRPARWTCWSARSGLPGAGGRALGSRHGQQMDQHVTLTAHRPGPVPELMDSVNELAYACRSHAAGRCPGADLCPIVHEHLRQGGAALLHRPGPLRPALQQTPTAADRRPRRDGVLAALDAPSSPRNTAPTSLARPASRSTSPTRSSTARR